MYSLFCVLINDFFYLIKASNDEIRIVNVTESNTVIGVTGIPLTLKCISEQKYLSNISWSTNGNILCEHYGNESTYKFLPCEDNQNATYTCTVGYIGKKIRKSVRLNLVPQSLGKFCLCLYLYFYFWNYNRVKGKFWDWW